MDCKTIGPRIREQRKLKKLSITELSEASFISEIYLREIECGKRTPSLPTYINIVNALNIPFDICVRDELLFCKTHTFNKITEMIKDLTLNELKLISETINTIVKHMKTDRTYQS